MQESDRQPNEVYDIPEIQNPAELPRIAHKIAWARMNGSLGVANPFVRQTPIAGRPEMQRPC